LVRLKTRNLLTRTVFDKTFEASDRFKEPDVQMVQTPTCTATEVVSTSWNGESFETLTFSVR
jgi:elongation factor P